MYYNNKTKQSGSLTQLLPGVANAGSLSADQLKEYDIYEAEQLSYNPLTQKEDGFIYNEELDQVESNIVDIVLPPLEEMKKTKLIEFRNQFIEIANLINYCKINQGDTNVELNGLIEYIKGVKDQSIAQINAFTDPVELITFRVKPEDKQAIIDQLENFM